jgi:NitT/TauT family transport system substrate-binding protein
VAAFVPFYVAVEGLYRAEGLEVELVTMQGSPGMAQALASDSVDIGVTALNTAINLLNAGQRVKAIWGVSGRAENAWFAKRDVAAWEDLKGRTMAVSGFGGFSDAISRHALRRHGLDPKRDVQMIQLGSAAARYQALAAGRVDAVILSPPFRWEAEAKGMKRLGTEAEEIAPDWPKGLFVVKESFIAANPRTLRAFLRAHVRAVRLARDNREAAVQALVKHLRADRPAAERAYHELAPGLQDRWSLPEQGMRVFWEIAVAEGEVSEAWPEDRFLDRRFLDSYDAWAPK